MTLSELRSKSVIELRKIARENQIVLGAGVDKATIVEKIAAAMGISVAGEQVPEKEAVPRAKAARPKETADSELPVGEDSAPSAPVLAPATDPLVQPESVSPAPAAAKPAVAPATSEEPRFQAAWHSPDAPASSHSSFGSSGNSRPAWQSTSPSGRPLSVESRPNPLRPRSFGPRFGPAAAASKTVNADQEAETGAQVRTEPSPRPSVSPLPGHRLGIGGGGFGPSAAPAAPAAPAADAPAQETDLSSDPMASLASVSTASSGSFMSDPAAPTLEELLSSGDFEEGEGILELHPDGFGFLRTNHFLPSSKDIYVSMAQIRRFALRTGDRIEGKIRPQREGDKYAALLYIDKVNGLPEEETISRPYFDELTPVYPTRRMSLEAKEGPSAPEMRLIDLIAPLGFGQRGLILCPPDTGKRDLLRLYANTISANYPDVNILMLLIDMNPEDVTIIRDQVNCPVLASTFDQAPEVHLRLAEMVIERAMRLVEQKKDVVILADSLTRLAKVYTSAAVQQGRSLPGMVNPASLLRAKKMFGAARALKEGGSLTVIAAMDIASGNKVDDSIVEEFKGTANMELTLDQSLVKAGISPAIQLQRSFTRNSDQLLNPQQKEGLQLIRQLLGTTSSATAIPQLLSMMDKTATNAELLNKMKDWFALMNM